MPDYSYYKARFENLERIQGTAYKIASAVGFTDNGFVRSCNGDHPAWAWYSEINKRIGRLRVRMLRRYQRDGGQALDGHVRWCPSGASTYDVERTVLSGEIKHIGDLRDVHPLVPAEVAKWVPLTADGDSESCEGHIYCHAEDMAEIERRIHILDPRAHINSENVPIEEAGHPKELGVRPGYMLANTRLAGIKVPSWTNEQEESRK